MRKINFFIFMILALSFGAAHAKTKVKLEWDIGKLPFEVKTAMGPSSISNRVAEHGVYNAKLSLPVSKKLDDGTFEVGSGEKVVLYLLIKNKGSKPIKFSVAPHSTHPGASALGFVFNCLCNGHVYEVPPGAIWYRIMNLNTTEFLDKEDITLKHTIFEVKK
jgi:hypothetical protein